MTSTRPASSETLLGATPHATMDAAGMTDVGRARPFNEDAYLIATLQRSMLVHDASPEAARGAAKTPWKRARGWRGGGICAVSSRPFFRSLSSSQI